MKKTLVFIVTYALFWLLFFEASRAFFIVYNYALVENLPWTTILQTFVAGSSHDFSLLSYLVDIEVIILIIAAFFFNRTIFQKILKWKTVLLLVLFSIITVIDAELYRNWGYRMDSTVLQYLETPAAAVASTPLWHIILLLLAIVVFVAGFYVLFTRFIAPIYKNLPPIKKIYLPVFVLIMAASVVTIRGGIGMATLRTGSVYFCKQPFANHAAINDHWHFLYSFGYNLQNEPITFMSEEECSEICAELLENHENTPIKLFNTNSPNVLLVILESFSAPQMQSLGGTVGITPCLDSIAQSGVQFTSCYSTCTKSEMGIVSILSGYPAQPLTSIIKYNEKSEKLPYLSHVFDSLGYNLSFFHGGDTKFGNVQSYLYFGKFNKCVTLNDFRGSQGNTEWGALDHVVFNRTLNDLNSQAEPFFSVCYTLSSHEPFEVPMKSRFYGKTEYEKFCNSVHYTDSCIGNFVNRAKQESWWNNTAVIFLSDHGSRVIGDDDIKNAPSHYHIPFIITGGAVRTDTIISEVVSQCDLPKILCNQLGVSSQQFAFSNDVLCGDEPFAYYAFNNGFGYVRKNQSFVWDCDNSQIILQSDSLNNKTIKQGQALLQKVTTDFCGK